MMENDFDECRVCLALLEIDLVPEGYSIRTGYSDKVIDGAKEWLGMTDERMKTIVDVLRRTVLELDPIINECMEDAKLQREAKGGVNGSKEKRQ